MTTTVFVRDDDLGRPYADMERFHRLFVERDIPIAYQVVPAFLDDATAAEASAMRRDHPELVELHQHGTHHEQILDGAHAWSEFAGTAPYPEQLAVLREGRDRLGTLLGDDLDPRVFTPPAHKYGPDTVRALEALGVETISCGVHLGADARVAYALGHLARRVRVLGRTISYHGTTLPGSTIREWSCALDIDQDGRGNRVDRSLAELRDAFTAARRRLGVVGLMLHHECYGTEPKFAALSGFLDDLAGDDTVRFVRLGALNAAGS